MKVALLYLGRKGGGEIYSMSIAKSLQNRVETDVIISDYAENKGVWEREIQRLFSVPTYTNIRSFIKQSISGKAILRIKKYLESENPSILYYPMGSPWSPAINILHRKKIIITTIHDLRFHKGDLNLLNLIMRRIIIRQSDGIIFLTEYAEESFKSKKIFKYTCVIPHGIFDHYLRGIKHEYQTYPNRANIVFIGRIEPYKGLQYLLEAYRVIHRRIPHSKLIIAGAGSLKKYSKSMKGLDGIQVINRWLSDREIGEILRRADLLVLPYIEASQSGIIALGQAFGVPIMASRIGGISEQIIDGETGILVAPRDSKELSKRAVELLNCEEERINLSNKEKKYAEKELSWDKITEDLLKFFILVEEQSNLRR